MLSLILCSCLTASSFPSSLFPQDAKPDRAALAQKYSDAMRDLSRRYPDDLDAATLYGESLMNLRAWKLWTLDGKPAPGRLENDFAEELEQAREAIDSGAAQTKLQEWIAVTQSLR